MLNLCQNKRMWILNSWKKDAFFIILSGPLIFLLMNFVGERSVELALLAILFLDSGHAYTTIFRTVFHEKKEYRLGLYYRLLLIVLVVVFLWQVLKIPYLFSMVIYFTFFHYLRQNYGILKWYELKNNQYLKMATWFIYLSNLIPFIGMHFRDNLKVFYYTGSDLFLYPEKNIFLIFQILQLLLLGGFLIFARLKRLCRPSFVFILSHILLYGLLLIPEVKALEAISVIVFSHGMGYLAIMQEGLSKTQPNRFKTLTKTSLFLFVFVLVVGPLEYFLEENYLDISNRYLYETNFLSHLLIGFYLLPTLGHYIFDGMIWRKSHPESQLIYKASSIKL